MPTSVSSVDRLSSSHTRCRPSSSVGGHRMAESRMVVDELMIESFKYYISTGGFEGFLTTKCADVVSTRMVMSFVEQRGKRKANKVAGETSSRP